MQWVLWNLSARALRSPEKDLFAKGDPVKSVVQTGRRLSRCPTKWPITPLMCNGPTGPCQGHKPWLPDVVPDVSERNPQIGHNLWS